MASLTKAAAFSSALKQCPFLSSGTLSFLKQSSSLYSNVAKRCPVMGQLSEKGVATLAVPADTTSEGELVVGISCPYLVIT